MYLVVSSLLRLVNVDEKRKGDKIFVTQHFRLDKSFTIKNTKCIDQRRIDLSWQIRSWNNKIITVEEDVYDSFHFCLKPISSTQNRTRLSSLKKIQRIFQKINIMKWWMISTTTTKSELYHWPTSDEIGISWRSC